MCCYIIQFHKFLTFFCSCWTNGVWFGKTSCYCCLVLFSFSSFLIMVNCELLVGFRRRRWGLEIGDLLATNFLQGFFGYVQLGVQLVCQFYNLYSFLDGCIFCVMLYRIQKQSQNGVFVENGMMVYNVSFLTDGPYFTHFHELILCQFYQIISLIHIVD